MVGKNFNVLDVKSWRFQFEDSAFEVLKGKADKGAYIAYVLEYIRGVSSNPADRGSVVAHEVYVKRGKYTVGKPDANGSSHAGITNGDCVALSLVEKRTAYKIATAVLQEHQRRDDNNLVAHILYELRMGMISEFHKE